jgi:hypothetical protein
MFVRKHWGQPQKTLIKRVSVQAKSRTRTSQIWGMIANHLTAVFGFPSIFQWRLINIFVAYWISLTVIHWSFSRLVYIKPSHAAITFWWIPVECHSHFYSLHFHSSSWSALLPKYMVHFYFSSWHSLYFVISKKCPNKSQFLYVRDLVVSLWYLKCVTLGDWC